jgi:hypothetical protein
VALLPHRHGRACPGNPRFVGWCEEMAATCPAMTVKADTPDHGTNTKHLP